MMTVEVVDMTEKTTVTGKFLDVLRPLDASHRRAVQLELRRRARRARSQLHGAIAKLRYRRTYGHPDLDVIPEVLADRIRSSLGPLELRLDIPHVHVMVEGKTALLHGDVATPADAAAIETAVARVAGVQAVESHLHIGLLPSDSRPSSGRAVHPASPARQQLQAAAVRGGGDVAFATDAVNAVLSVFIRRLPPVEAQHVLGHLPSDVCELVHRRTWLPTRRVRTVDQLVWHVTVESDHLSPEISEAVTRSVLATLRSLVPDEGNGVTDVLPEKLRPLWAVDTTTTTDTAPRPPLPIA